MEAWRRLRHRNKGAQGDGLHEVVKRATLYGARYGRLFRSARLTVSFPNKAIIDPGIYAACTSAPCGSRIFGPTEQLVRNLPGRWMN